jgi:hypothetical protein
MPQGDFVGIFDDDDSDSGYNLYDTRRPSLCEVELAEDVNWAEMVIDDEDPALIEDESPSRLEWLRQKREQGQTNEYLDSLMSMIGHEAVKARFLTVKSTVEWAKRVGKDVEDLPLDLILQGNSGSGEVHQPLLAALRLGISDKS